MSNAATQKTGNGTSAETSQESTPCLREHVRECLQSYFKNLDGHTTVNLYDTVMLECELPLIQVVMNQSNGNISQAARTLGINRSTLKRKLQQHGLG